jgi:hypothetical protein
MRAQGVLELGAETGERGAADLLELGGQLLDAGEESLVLLLDLAGRVVRGDDLAAERVDAPVDLVLVVSAENLRELGLFDGQFFLRGRCPAMWGVVGRAGRLRSYGRARPRGGLVSVL